MGMGDENRATGCILIPAFNEAGAIATVVAAAQAYLPAVVVIDDGSADDTVIRARAAGAHVIEQAENAGKGAALERGFQYAREQGFDFVITMDADGQHDAADLPNFIEAYAAGAAPVIIGNRMAHPDTMPLVRRLTNRFMSWLLSRKMRQWVPDTQNGYRLYRTAVIPPPDPEHETRFAAESETLLELAVRGVKMSSVPTRVIYGDERSKINPVKDTLRFFRMLTEFHHRMQQTQG
jgi:glycosyltransferase involved in cell wall biosynthesis